MRRIYGKKLMFAVVASLLAGTVPAWAADVTGQQVTIDSDQTGELIYGGYSGEGSASGNTLSVIGGTTTLRDAIAGGIGGTEAVGNQLTVSGNGTVTSTGTYYVYGGDTAGEASNNAVVVSENGAITGNAKQLFGGYSEHGSAEGNRVDFSSSKNQSIDEIYGGYTNGTGAANGNAISLTNGTFDSELIAGGYSYSPANDPTANNNRVSVGGEAKLTITAEERF